MKLSQEQFCKMHSGYYGEVIDNVNQIAPHAFTSGEELREYVESMINQYLSDQPAPVSVGNEKSVGQIINRILRENDARFTDFEKGLVEIMMKEYADQFRSAHSIPSRELGYSYQTLINLVDSLKEYTKESQSILGNDDREADEFVKIFLSKNNQAAMFPSREEAEREAKMFAAKECGYDNLAARDTREALIKGALKNYDWLLSQIGQPGDGFIGVEKSSEIINDTNLLAAYNLLMDAHNYLAKSKLTTDDYGYFSKILVDVKIKLRQLPSPPKQ